MDVRQLKYFIAVCDAGSFSAAAEKLFISQQGLSMAVLRLEKELSCTLLKRTAAGVELTEQGEYLLPKAKEIVAAVVACEGHFEELRRRKTTVEVACAYGVMGEFAGQMIRDFQAKNPTFRVTMGEYPDLLCEEAVMEGQAELERYTNEYLVSEIYRNRGDGQRAGLYSGLSKKHKQAYLEAMSSMEFGKKYRPRQ